MRRRRAARSSWSAASMASRRDWRSGLEVRGMRRVYGRRAYPEDEIALIPLQTLLEHRDEVHLQRAGRGPEGGGPEPPARIGRGELPELVAEAFRIEGT